MTDDTQRDEIAASAARRFAIRGELEAIEPHRRGHIHDTFVSVWQEGGAERRYLHQRINETVFGDVDALMHNVERVTRHLRAAPGEHLEALELVPTDAGASWLRNSSGAWRTYVFIDGAESYDRCRDTAQAWRAARAFGDFQRRLLDLDAGELAVTIPRFFDSPHRLVQLEAARRADVAGRAGEAGAELAFVDDRRSLVPVIEDALAAGRFPPRVVHGDTKLNNVLFDRASGAARCVVDLDTCMAGWSLYDFGDLVRFTAATSAEDDPDVARAGVALDLYDALAAGYLEGTGGFLSEEERALMPTAARLVTLTIGMRFLADHLAGDVYFKVSRPGHNLDRARVQLAMVADMERKQAAMERAGT